VTDKTTPGKGVWPALAVPVIVQTDVCPLCANAAPGNSATSAPDARSAALRRKLRCAMVSLLVLVIVKKDT
jgi:hypothetical protein